MSPDYLMAVFYVQVGTLIGVVLYVAGRILYTRKRTK